MTDASTIPQPAPGIQPDGAAPVPPRVAARPRPELWGMTELMTLPEAVALHWPDGPLTVKSLRVAIQDGDLPVARIAGKHLVNREAIAAMSACKPLAPPGRRGRGSPSPPAPAAAEAADRPRSGKFDPIADLLSLHR